jgi:hypothetical protein
MKTLILFVSFFVISNALASIEKATVTIPNRDLKKLYEKLNSPDQLSKVESGNIVLKEYHLVVSSSSTWAGAAQVEALWEELAEERERELNIVVIYDSPNQDVSKIKAKSAQTKLYEFFDQNRGFYWWFSKKVIMDSFLIGPDGTILFEGVLNSREAVEKVKALVKKKNSY